MSSSEDSCEHKLEKQNKLIEAYKDYCHRLQTEIDKLKAELVKYRGY